PPRSRAALRARRRLALVISSTSWCHSSRELVHCLPTAIAMEAINQFFPLSLDHTDKQFAVCVPGVAAAVAPSELLMKAIDDIALGQVTGRFQTLKQVIALGIHVGRGDMGNLAGRAAQADALVIDGGPDPDRPAIPIDPLGLPEANVVALPWVGADR